MTKEEEEETISDFEEARFKYCAQLFEKEEKRRELLEKKAQFY